MSSGLKVANNPPEPAPPYPGKWSRNNKSGIMLSMDEFLEEKASEWYNFVKVQSNYKNMFMTNKARLLLSHLCHCLPTRTIKQSKCRQLVQRLEGSRNVNVKMEPECCDEGMETMVGCEDRQNGEEKMEANGGNESLEAQHDNEEAEGAGSEAKRGNEDMFEAKGDTTEGFMALGGSDEDMEKLAEDGPNREERTRAVALLKNETDEFLFESKPELEEKLEAIGIRSPNKSNEVKERRESFARNYCKDKTDQELFRVGAEVNRHVRETSVFKERGINACTEYVRENMEGLSPDLVLVALSNTFQYLKFPAKTKTEKSDQKVLQSLQDTVDKLKQTNSKEGREQVRLLAAGACSLEDGVPSLGVGWRVGQEAKEMKEQLMKGKSNLLSQPKKEKRIIFPPEVHRVANRHWLEITVTEPSKHQRLKKTVKDGDETVPTQYQTSTNEEAYASFKENCTEEVGKIMKNHAQTQIEKLSKRPDSEEKQHRIKYTLEKLGNRFPCQNWFMDQRPLQVEMMHDHTTGCCKVSFLYMIYNL